MRGDRRNLQIATACHCRLFTDPFYYFHQCVGLRSWPINYNHQNTNRISKDHTCRSKRVTPSIDDIVSDGVFGDRLRITLSYLDFPTNQSVHLFRSRPIDVFELHALAGFCQPTFKIGFADCECLFATARNVLSFEDAALA